MSVTMQSVPKPRRRVHSDSLKRRLVEASLVPGASVAAIALEHGINANLLFSWRREHLRSQAAGHAENGGQATRPTLLPVEVVSAASAPAAPAAAPPRGSSAAGSIEIDLGSARVRLRGTVDEASLRSVLAALRVTGS